MRFKVAAVDNIHFMYSVSYFKGQVKLCKTKISDKVDKEVLRTPWVQWVWKRQCGRKHTAQPSGNLSIFSCHWNATMYIVYSTQAHAHTVQWPNIHVMCLHYTLSESKQRYHWAINHSCGCEQASEMRRSWWWWWWCVWRKRSGKKRTEGIFT